MCDFTFYAATILSVPSVWRSCNSRAGNAEGELSEEKSKLGSRWLDEMGAPAVTVFWMGPKWHRLGIYYITIL